jgi:DNA-binding response OmpR family regulator
MSKILVIEDDAEWRYILSEYLTIFKFQVIPAENGFIGLQLAKEQHPDLIICDIKMPHLDGYQVFQNLREDANTANIPFFFVTSETDINSRCRAFQMGANNYLTKPLDPERLLTAIATQMQLPEHLPEIHQELT